MPVPLQKRMRACKRPTMESLKTLSVLGIHCLLCTSLVGGAVDSTRGRAVYNMRDSVHQIGYNYPIWPPPSPPLPEPTHSATTRPLHEKPQQSSEVVTTLERFHRVSPDGSVEFKISLSDGQINHQKIYNQVRNGQLIQTRDGYYSERLADERYRTVYYKADELGYRILRMDMGTVPPVGFWMEKKKSRAEGC